MSEETAKAKTETIIADLKERHVWPYNQDGQTDQDGDTDLTHRLWLLYNRLSSLSRGVIHQR